MPIYLAVPSIGLKLACDEVGLVGAPAAPRDPMQGHVTGRRQHCQFTVIYDLGTKVNPFAPLAQGQTLRRAALEFTKTLPGGRDQVVRSLQLGDVKIVSTQPTVPGKRGGIKSLTLEITEVGLVFEKISLAFGNSGKAFKDNWN
jgi:type VI protein secretion system component Hcp